MNRCQNEVRRLYREPAWAVKSNSELPETIHNQGQASRQQSPAEYCDRKRQICSGPAGARTIQQIVNAALHHEDR